MRRTRPTGFALLMTLVLVLLAGVALVGLARRSAIGALEAQSQVERLQRHWAVKSLQATLLERVDDLLAEAETATAGPDQEGVPAALIVPELRVTCFLSGSEYELVLTDEQAKVDVNRVLRDSSPAEAAALVRRLVESTAFGAVEVQVRPWRLHRAAQGQAVGGYGQVFPEATPEALLGRHDEPGAASAVTCWGGGALSVRRASDAAILLSCRRTMGPDLVNELVAARRRVPPQDLTIARLIAAMDSVSEPERRTIQSCLTDGSTAHGLWIVAHGKQRSWHHLSIALNDSQGGIAQWLEFEW